MIGKSTRIASLGLVSLGCGAADALLLVFSIWYFTGFPPAWEILVIGAGLVLGLAAVVCAILAEGGRRAYRLLRAALGLVTVPGWGVMCIGAYM